MNSSHEQRDIHFVDESKLRLLPETASNRRGHPFLVVSAKHFSPIATTPIKISQIPRYHRKEFSEWNHLIGIPISTSENFRTRFCIEINRGDGTGVSEKSWVRVPMIQPISKSSLAEKQGVLSQDKFDDVLASLFRYFGL